MTQPAASALEPGTGIGDHALFVDHRTDGAGYVILTRLTHGAGARNMHIFKLTPDFMDFEYNVVNGSVARNATTTGVLPGQHLVEAPAMFERNSVYYALLGGCSCMGLYGGGVNVLTAAHPLGPWENVSAAVDPGCDMWRQSSCFEVGPGEVCNAATQAQQNFVMEVPLSDGSTAYVWTGDRWQQSPDHMYDSQPQTWVVLEFDGDGRVLPMNVQETFELDIAVV